MLEQLARPGGPSLEFKFSLMRKAFAHTAEFDSLIAQTMETIGCTGTDFVRQAGAISTYRTIEVADSRCGTARTRIRQAEWGPLPAGFGDWQVHQGKELSYTNLLDLDAALRIAVEFTEPAAVVIKHTNPCGVATGATIAEAYVAAREADPLSAFGGIVGLNHAIDAATATAIASTFIEAVIAPSIDEDARAILCEEGEHARVDRGLRRGPRAEAGGRCGRSWAVSSRRMPIASRKPANPWPPPSRPDSIGARRDRALRARAEKPEIRVVTKRQPTAEEWIALRFAWRVCAHVKSNTIVFTGADRTLAIGAGQMSRVDAVKVAVMKATGTARGQRRRLRRVLPVPGRSRRRRGRRRHGRRPARRIGPGRGGDCRRRRARLWRWSSRGAGISGTDGHRHSRFTIPATHLLQSLSVPRYRLGLAALLALAILPYFVDLNGSSIWDANEAFYVETPREMIERGDYIAPTFNYQPRFNKPVLSYWIVAGFYKLFGVSVAVQRFRSRSGRPC